jgi:hypothetical protein
MDATFTLYQRHERGIHAVSTRLSRAAGRGSTVTGVCWEHVSTRGPGRGPFRQP